MLHRLFKITLVSLLLYLGLILMNPDVFAPKFLPDMDSRYEVDGWIFFSRDKLGHFFLIGLAALILNILLKAKKVNFKGYPILLGSIIVAVLVTLEEFRQVPLPNRSFEMFDIFYNFAGILIFGRVGEWLVKKNWLHIF